MREFKINANDAGQRLDKFIQKTVTGIPVSLMYKAIRLKKIKVNRKRAEQKQMLMQGDTVQMFLSEDLFSDKITDNELLTIKPKINVIYEDENIILCDKGAGVLVHSGDGDGKTSGEGACEDRNTLVYHMQAYLAQKGEYDPSAENSFAPALCNRIDRNTGGIVIAAKTAEAPRVMNEKIKAREIDKFYLAAVHGIPEKSEATLTGYLLKDEKTNTVRVDAKNPPKNAKNIITKYKVIAKGADTALLEVELLTGRTHQIRAHLAFIGHPLVGDGKYGINRDDRERGYKYQALYSYRLRFSFKGEPTALEYLNGKEFKINKKDIYFTRDYF